MYQVFNELNADRDWVWFSRFLFYFICFYDPKGAEKFADSTKGFEWDSIRELADEPTTRRGTERRHFRGDNARKALINFQRKGMTMLEILDDWAKARTFTELAQNIQTNYAGTQMGPYFIWKVYDLLVYGMNCDIEMNLKEALRGMPEEPLKAARHFWPDKTVEEVVGMINAHIEHLPHPVRADLHCSYAEVETILCMMKGAFWTKSHQIGDDIGEKHAALNGSILQGMLPPRIDGRYKAGELVL